MGSGDAGGVARGCSGRGAAKDLLCGGSALLLWCLPIGAVIVGGAWASARAWLWIPAFLVMGAGCLANAARCGRVHCYLTGPVFLLAALWLALGALGWVPTYAGAVLGAVVLLTGVAYLAEFSLGKYRRTAAPPTSGR